MSYVQKVAEKKNFELVLAGASDYSDFEKCGVKLAKYGRLNKDQLIEVYTDVDFTLVPSLDETFSNTCAESLLCGTPVIGTPVGAIPDMVIDEKTGVLSKSTSAYDLKDAILRAHKMSFDPLFCRKFILNNFSQVSTAFKYLSLYQTILDSKNKHNASLRVDNQGMPNQIFNSPLSMPFIKRLRFQGPPEKAFGLNKKIPVSRPLVSNTGEALAIDFNTNRLIYSVAEHSRVIIGDLNIIKMTYWLLKDNCLCLSDEFLLTFRVLIDFNVSHKDLHYLLLRDGGLLLKNLEHKKIAFLDLNNFIKP